MAHRVAEKVAVRPSLRVLQRGDAMVQDYRALFDTGTRRFVGLRFDPTLGPEFFDEFDHQTKRHGGFVKLTDEPVTIANEDPYYGEYVKHIKQGDLWAADAATAAAAGVVFEPDFLGEHPETAKAAKVTAVKPVPASAGK
jgi:hypothetical protein